MTGIRQLASLLKAEITSPRHRERWEIAQRRHPMLRRVADIQVVLRVLGNLKRADLRYKDILTRAIIAEHKANPGPFWTAVLLLIYSPMLGGLRARIFGNAFDREDLDQLVVDAFLSAARVFPLTERRSRTFLFLKYFTSQQVFRVIRTRQKEIKQQHQLITLAQRFDEFDLFGEVDSDESDVDRDDMAEFLTKIASGREPSDNLNLIIDTVIYRKKLTDYVAEKFPCDDPEQQERVYQRIKKQRCRSLGRLRALLLQNCPQISEEGVCSFEQDSECGSNDGNSGQGEQL